MTTLYSFADSVDGGEPWSGLALGNDGNFYGTASTAGVYNAGTIFKITPTGTLSTIYSFEYPDNGFPEGGLLQATSGVFYGATPQGGNLSCGNGVNGCGTLYSLDTGLGPFAAFVLAGGRDGQTAEILGQGFEGTSAVSFNGVPAQFSVVSDTYLTATIPVGATTGSVTVTTPTGVLTSNVPFRVIP